MRINQFVASATGMSRRAADAAIAAGRVSIAGRPAKLGEDAGEGPVSLDGQPLTLQATHAYIMFNKPAGYVSSRVRQGDDPTLYELLPAEHHTLRTVGRLDRDSSGLILLSDDGDFIQRHTHPSFEKTKIYELTLERALTDTDRGKLKSGITLTDGPSHVAVIASDGTQVRVGLGEGRNRQLRRTFGALGYTITRLHRTAMGNYQLGDLPEGSWKPVSPEERA